MKLSADITKFTIGALGLLAVVACSGGEQTKGAAASTETTSNAASTAGSDVTTAPVTYASLTGVAANGATKFLQCKACHAVEAGQNRIGPSLNGVIGRKAGQVAGFSYSEANKNSGFVWSEEKLFEYLENPRKVMPGTKMSYAGLANPQDRADVIAYLKTEGK